ncbi:MAG: TIGR01244 family sulfur transferase [Pseudomonadota bacterium]
MLDRFGPSAYPTDMDLRQLGPRYFVSPQIEATDMPAIKAAGITLILCNRPDDEVPPSHSSAAIAQAAQDAALGFAAVPLTMQTIIPDVIAENHAAGAATGEVVLAYCASGTRSTIAWSLAQAGTMPADEIMEAGRQAGYDLSSMRRLLDAPFT